ncbi:MAG: hypothetical protein LUE86_10905, partial [Clostridiales bacterium]|nr:hypothetical protein [Clostridiales bacterium]
MGIFSRDYERIEEEESRYFETTVVEENPGEIIIEIPDDGQKIGTLSDEAESEAGLTPGDEDTAESETETQEETEEYENTEEIPAEPYIPPELIASPGDAVPMNAISTGEYRPGGVVSKS